MDYFTQLNKAWQDGINETINDVDGGERPEVAAGYREVEAQSLLECKIAREPPKTDLADISTAYINFKEGWDGALNRLMKDQAAAIASWVRAHGEPTNYAPLEGPEYPAFIIKESDLSV